MSLPELAWRTERALRARADRLLGEFGREEEDDPSRIADPMQSGEMMLFGPCPPALLPAEQGRMELVRALAEASSVEPDEGSLLDLFGGRTGIVDQATGIPPEWNRDPLSGRGFALRHWSKVDYRRPEDAEAIRRLWYLARCRQLPSAALPFYLAGDGTAAAATAAAIGSFIQQCPPGRGIHWLVPLELALRLIAWSYAARLLAGSPVLAGLAPTLARSVHRQAEYIRANLSRYSSANNHLIGQAAGLVHAGTAFAGLKLAPLWRETGRDILWREILRQTSEDGVSREASTHYHELVLELGLLVWLLMRAGGDEPPPQVRERLLGMLELVAELDAFPGGPPEVGDSDGQSVLPFACGDPPRRTLLAIGAVLGRRGDWKAQCRGLSRQAVLLLGARGRDEFHDLPAVRPGRKSRRFSGGSWALLRDGSGDRGLFFDCGDLGYLSTAAHGHADCLSIVLGAFGEHLLVDPGTYTYHAEPSLRDFFRSTAAHNTVRVDGLDQSEMRGAFLWGRRAKGRLIEWVNRSAVDLAAGEHDGYRHLPAPVMHRRTITFVKPDYVWVHDRLEGEGHHLAEQFLHLGSVEVHRGPGRSDVLACTPAGPALWILVPGEANPEVELLTGCDAPLQGWISPRFGERRPGVTWRRVVEGPVPADLHLLLKPLAASQAPGAVEEDARELGRGSGAVQPLGSGHALHVHGMPGDDLVCLAPPAAAEVRGEVAGTGRLAGKTLLAGRLALVRWGGDGWTALAGERLRRLEAGGELVLETEGEAASFSLRRLGDRAVVEGSGGRVHLRAAGIREVRAEGVTLAVEHSGEWMSFALPGETRTGGESADREPGPAVL
jgi:hypothetical protein